MKHITITIEPAFHDEVRNYCKSRGMKLSTLISLLLKKEVESGRTDSGQSNQQTTN